MESVVKVLVTTLAFSTQAHTSRALSPHYPHRCKCTTMHKYAHTHTHANIVHFPQLRHILIVLYKEVMRTFLKSITFNWEAMHLYVCLLVRLYMCKSVCP